MAGIVWLVAADIGRVGRGGPGWRAGGSWNVECCGNL